MKSLAPKSPTIRVLHVFGKMDRGGAEVCTLELIQELKDSRYQFVFCTLSGEKGDLADEFEKLGALVLPCAARSPWFAFRFVRLLKENKIDIVHSHVHFFSGLIHALATLAGVQGRASHLHSLSDGQPPSLRRWIQREFMKKLFFRYSKRIIGVSKGVLDSNVGPQWSSLPACRLVYTGIQHRTFPTSFVPNEVKEEWGIPPESSLLIHVGNLTPAKNHKRLLSIFHELLQQKNDCFLLLVGRQHSDVYLELLEQQKQLGLEGKVFFAGVRSDVPRLLGGAELMVFPSVREGLSIALLEACVCGIPIVASDLPGNVEIEEQIRHVHTLSLQQENSIWVKTILALLAHESSSRKKERIQRRQNFEESVFQIEKNAQDIASIWEELYNG